MSHEFGSPLNQARCRSLAPPSVFPVIGRTATVARHGRSEECEGQEVWQFVIL